MIRKVDNLTPRSFFRFLFVRWHSFESSNAEESLPERTRNRQWPELGKRTRKGSLHSFFHSLIMTIIISRKRTRRSDKQSKMPSGKTTTRTIRGRCRERSFFFFLSFFSFSSRLIVFQEEQERKKAEAQERKLANKAAHDEEMNKLHGKVNSTNSSPSIKVTQAQIAAQRREEQARREEEERLRIIRAARIEQLPEEIEDNVNRLALEPGSARNVNEAIQVCGHRAVNYYFSSGCQLAFSSGCQ